MLLNFAVGAEEEAVGRNRDAEFKQEQSHEYIRPYARQNQDFCTVSVLVLRTTLLAY